jgi:hypothetical protein
MKLEQEVSKCRYVGTVHGVIKFCSSFDWRTDICLHCRSRNAMSRSVPTIHAQPLQQPQFVQVEVSDADNQQFIVYAD